MVFNANISAITRRLVLLVEETGVPGENHPPATNIITYFCIRAGFELTTVVVIGTDCICSCKSNNHTITI